LEEKMHEDLWAGVDLKQGYAEFFLHEMTRSLQPPEGAAALEGAGAIVDTQWQQSFYPRLDAFLAMARSIPEIIQACFGEDLGSKPMKLWSDALEPDERTRRQKFSAGFKPCYETFRQHPLSNARNISFHRTGYSDVQVSITGRFGVNHVGSPVKAVPTAESRPISDIGDTPVGVWAATQAPQPIRPRWTDFTLDGKPLFDECRTYLELAKQLVEQARGICLAVHETAKLAIPPSS
jgi:hypothetical protein